MSDTPRITEAHLEAARAWGRLSAWVDGLSPPDNFAPEEKAAWRAARAEARLAARTLAAEGGALQVRPDGSMRHIPLDELYGPPPSPTDRET